MNLEKALKEIDQIKSLIDKIQIPTETQHSLKEDFNLRYTYESNAIEGNTLTLMETKVVLEGVTIGGKTLREHFEVINHHHAINFIENLVKEKQDLSEYDIKSIHSLILKGIDDENAGAYRKCDVRIAGAEHIPPNHFEVSSQIQDFIKWYQNEGKTLHPIIRASRVHILLVGIHPFIDGNGRTSRLVMNLELLKEGYLAINIKNANKLEYYNALDLAHTKKEYSKFDLLIAKYSLDTFKERLEKIKQKRISPQVRADQKERRDNRKLETKNEKTQKHIQRTHRKV